MKTIKIKGMSCQHCVMTVTKALRDVAGVKDVKIDLATGEAVIEEAAAVEMQSITDAVKKAGFEVG